MSLVALQGERWFLGKIYGYPHEALYFGVPLANFFGWAVVGVGSLFVYRWLERGPYKAASVPQEVVRRELFLSIGLFYGVLAFNLGVTFWIGGSLHGNRRLLYFYSAAHSPSREMRCSRALLKGSSKANFWQEIQL